MPIHSTQQDQITFYYFPTSRTLRVRWLLEELKLDYAINYVDLSKKEQEKDSYRKIHPLAKVPALTIGDTTLFESLAICLHLADRFKQPSLAPEIKATDRGEYLQWMALASGTLEPAIIEQHRYKKAKALGVDPIDMGPTLTPFSTIADYIEKTLSKRPFLLGDAFSAADIMVATLFIWAKKNKLDFELPATKKWLQQLQQRPAFQRSIAA